MPDFASRRAAGASSFADGRGRKEVMKHEAFVLRRLDVIDALRVRISTQRSDADGLRLPAREKRAPVRSRQKTRFAGDRANHPRRATVLATSVGANRVAKRSRLNLTARVDNGGRLLKSAKKVIVSISRVMHIMNLECVQRAVPEVLGCDTKVGRSPVRSIRVYVRARS